jgi:hypothetical protein
LTGELNAEYVIVLGVAGVRPLFNVVHWLRGDTCGERELGDSGLFRCVH